MCRIGRTIRSAKMNASTPPKLIPPFQSTAANGTLPTEQTKLMIATAGAKHGYAGWTIRQTQGTLGKILGRAARRGLIPSNPASRLERGELASVGRREQRVLRPD